MPADHIYEFGEFRLDSREGALLRRSERIPLTPKALRTLFILVERHGHIVEKEELMKQVWPNTFVEEASLARNVFVLRKVLEEGLDGQESIETIPKRGYRFIAPVTEVPLEVAPRTSPVESPPSLPQLVRSRRRLIAWAAPLGLAALSLAAYFIWHDFPPRALRTSPRIMLAVLPVQNLTADTSLDYLCDGLTEELISQLGGFNPHELGVIARTSSMAYKNTNKTIAQIGRDLGVDYLLETTLRESGNHLRINSQLIRTRDQTHVWAASYDRQLGDTLALENEVSRAVARQIQVTLTPLEEARRAATRPVNPDVYELYLLGRYQWNKRTDAGLKKAIEYFQQAIDRDPGYAQAYAGLADSYVMSFYYGSAGSPKEYFPRAKAAAERALELEEQLSEAHATLGIINSASADLTAGEREYKRALELDPNYATAHQWYAFTLLDMGRQEEGISEIERARELDPLSLIINSDAGWILYYAHRPDAASSQLRKALDLDPNFVPAHLALAHVYAQERKFAEAIAEAQKASDLFTTGPETLAALGYAYAVAGKRTQAQAVLAELRNLSRQRHVSPYWTARVYAGLGERDRALEELEKTYAERSPLLLNVKLDPVFDSLRSDPRFKDLFHRIGIPP